MADKVAKQKDLAKDQIKSKSKASALSPQCLDTHIESERDANANVWRHMLSLIFLGANIQPRADPSFIPADL